MCKGVTAAGYDYDEKGNTVANNCTKDAISALFVEDGPDGVKFRVENVQPEMRLIMKAPELAGRDADNEHYWKVLNEMYQAL